MRKRTNYWNKQNDEKIIDGRQLTDWSAVPQLANAELGKHVVHLQKDELQKSDQKKKSEEPVKAGLIE